MGAPSAGEINVTGSERSAEALKGAMPGVRQECAGSMKHEEASEGGRRAPRPPSPAPRDTGSGVSIWGLKSAVVAAVKKWESCSAGRGRLGPGR